MFRFTDVKRGRDGGLGGIVICRYLRVFVIGVGG